MFRDLLFRLQALFRRSRIESEMDEELRAHIRNRADDLERSGFPRAEAERRARVEFGGVERFKQECREALGTRFLEALVQDVRLAFRMLRNSPGFALVAILTLALGLGANTTMFSLVDGILLRPLHYYDSSELVQVWSTQRGRAQQIAVSPADYLATRDRGASFQQVALYTFSQLVYTTRHKAESFFAVKTTASLFPLFHVKPILGRNFTPTEEQPGGRRVAILSYHFWQENFAGNRNALGKTITLDHEPYVIVGIMPASFDFPVKTNLWLPLVMPSDQSRVASWHGFTMIARLKPGVTIDQARADLRSTAELVTEQYPSQRGWGLQAVSLLDQVVGHERALLLALLGAAGFVLLIACANIAGLLVARGMRRQKEIAIRLTLGATRRRIIRLLLTESLLMSMAGAALGLGGAVWAVGFLKHAGGALLPRTENLGIDPRILGFTLFLALLAGVLAGLLPSLGASKLDLNVWLKEGVPGMGVFGHMRRERLRFVLVAVEVALATVLLVGSALLLRSFYRLTGGTLGFDPHNVVEVNIPLSRQYKSPAAQAMFFRNVLERVRSVRGVSSATVTNVPPFVGSMFEIAVVRGREVSLQVETPGPSYFRTLKIPVLRGRDFGPDDSLGTPKVAIINQTMERRFWPHKNPLGQEVKFPNKPAEGIWRIVGVVGDTRALFGQPVQAEIYLLLYQQPSDYGVLLVRTERKPANLLPMIRKAVWSVDRSQLLAGASTMDQDIWSDKVEPLFRTLLLGAYAALALLLALIGVYAVAAFWVTQRTHEIGVRLALGAQREDVLGMVVRQGALATVAGLALGLGGAWGVTRVLQSYLYGIRPTDPLSYAAAAAAILLTALTACYLPARRAARLDPAASLRYE